MTEVPTEARLLRRALAGELDLLLNKGFEISILKPPYNEAFKRLVEYRRKYDELPTKDTLPRLFDGLDVLIAAGPQAKSRITAYWDMLLEELTHDDTVTVLEAIAGLHNSGTMKGQQLLDTSLLKLSSVRDKFANASSVTSSTKEVGHLLREEYFLTKAGNMPGMPIDPNFKILVDGLGKLRPAQITTIVSRTSVGKTWLCLLLALHVAVNGYRVLISSMEMTSGEIGRRLAALHALVNFDSVIKGILFPESEEKYLKVLDDMENRRGFWDNFRFLNPSQITSIDSVENQAHAFDAQLVVADAFYDYPAPVDYDDNWKTIGYNLKQVRRISLITARHWILTAQFTKQARGMGSANEYAVAGADAFNHISNNMIYLFQQLRDKRSRLVVVSIGKGRDSAPQMPYRHNWDFCEMKWNPIGKYAEGGMSEGDSGLA